MVLIIRAGILDPGNALTDGVSSAAPACPVPPRVCVWNHPAACGTTPFGASADAGAARVPTTQCGLVEVAVRFIAAPRHA
jgi:hypothetical protein